VNALRFTVAHFALVLWGLPAAFHPSLRGASLAARAAAAFAAGAVALTLEATLFSTLGIPWSVASLSLPLLGISLALAIRWARRRSFREPRFSPSGGLGAAAAMVGALGLVHMGLSLAAARATSPDFLFFWGVKGARFAASRGIEPGILGFPYSHHMVPDYPPLVPVLFSWSTFVAGELPWRFAPVLAALWVVAAIPLLTLFLRRSLPSNTTAAVAAFWTAAIAISIVRSSSGGNAEAPLLFFETAALVALLAERSEETYRSRFFPALALSGAALTKVEGLVAALFILAGVALRDYLERRPRLVRRLLPLAGAPLFCVAVWFAFQAAHGLRAGYRTHGELFGVHFRYLGSVLVEMVRNLDAGTVWLSWIVPLAFLTVSARHIRAEVLPALSLATGLLLFFLFDYLHDATDPSIRIVWTLPRISQPALSAVILAAGVASAARARTSRGEELARRDGSHGS
jgi:hypothetical protein